MDKNTENTIAHRAIQRAGEAKKIHDAIKPLHEELRRFAMPGNEALGLGYSPTDRTGKYSKMLFEGEMQLSAIKHSGGVKSWMAPATTKFFNITPPAPLKKNKRAAAWCNKLTDFLHTDLATGGFHSADHAAINDGAVFGHRNVRVHEQPDGSIIFRHIEVGNYSFLTNEKGLVDSVFSTVKFSARQAAQKFGEDMLPQSVKNKLTEANAATLGESEEEYLYCCMPRLDAERDANFPFMRHNMPFAILWIHVASKTIVMESGSWFLPDHVSRYLRCGNATYGIGAAEMALIAARCANEISKDLDTLIKKKVNPTLLAPHEMDAKDINNAPGAINWYRDPNRTVKEMYSVGSAQDGEARLQQRVQAIRNAFFLDIFEALSRKTKEMSATEASMLSEEQIRMFSPTFDLMASEHYQPIILHVAIIRIMQSQMAHQTGDVSRQWFDPIPDELITPSGNLADLQIGFVSKMALALQAVHAGAFERSIAMRTEIANVIGAEAFDDLDLATALSDIDRSRGLPEEWRRDPEEVKAIQEARRQQQQMQMEAEAAGKAAPAVKALTTTP